MNIRKILLFLICAIVICCFTAACAKGPGADSAVNGGNTSESPSDGESSGGKDSSAPDDSELITFAVRSAEVALGEDYTVTIATMPQGAVPVWSVSDDNIITVDQSGKVTALSIGEAIVYAEVSEYVKASLVVTVKQILNPVYSIGLSTIDTQIYVGQDLAIVATVRYGDKTISGPSLIWQSEDKSVAAVNDDGVITGKASGETVVTVRYYFGNDFVEQKCKVKVIN